MEKSGDLPRIIGGTKPGSRAALQLFRRGATKDVAVVVAEFEADRPARRAQAERGASSAPPAKTALGWSVGDLTDGQKTDRKLRNGVRVDAAEGPAAKAGLREGDVILAMDNTEVTDVKQVVSIAARAEKSRAVSVMVRRGEFVSYLLIRPAGR